MIKMAFETVQTEYGTGASEPGSDKLDFDPAIIARDTKTVVVSFNYRVNL